MATTTITARMDLPAGMVEWAQLEELNLVEELVDEAATWDVEPVHDGGYFGWQATRVEQGLHYGISVLMQPARAESVPPSADWEIAVSEERPQGQVHRRIESGVAALAAAIAAYFVFALLGGRDPRWVTTAFRVFWAFVAGLALVPILFVAAVPVRGRWPAGLSAAKPTARFEFLVEQVRGALRSSRTFSKGPETGSQ